MVGYFYSTPKGTVQLVPLNGRWLVVYDEENLGSYHSAVAAADDVAGGHTYSPSNGVDLGELAIPYDIGEWTPYRTG